MGAPIAKATQDIIDNGTLEPPAIFYAIFSKNVFSCQKEFMKDGHLLSCHCWISFLLVLHNQLRFAFLVNLNRRVSMAPKHRLRWTFSRAGVTTPFLDASAQSFSKLRKFQGEESRLLQKNCWNSLTHGKDFKRVLIGRQTCNSADCSRPPCKGLQLCFCQARGEKSTQIRAQASLNPPLKKS